MAQKKQKRQLKVISRRKQETVADLAAKVQDLIQLASQTIPWSQRRDWKLEQEKQAFKDNLRAHELELVKKENQERAILELDPMTISEQVAHIQNTLSQRQSWKDSFEVDKKEEVDYIRMKGKEGKGQKLTESYKERHDNQTGVKETSL